MTDSKQLRTDIGGAPPKELADAGEVRRSVTRLGRRLRGDASGRGPELSLGKLSVLGHLQANGPLAAGDLATRERARPQSLTRVLAELERDGLIRRAEDPQDRRRSIMHITPRGSGALLREMRGRDAWLAAAMAAQLTPTERDLLVLAARLLNRLADFDGA